NGLTERDVDVRFRSLIDGAVSWRRRGDGWRGVCRLETKDKVRVHVVRRIAAVLVVDLRSEDRDRARFTGGKVSIRIDRERSWTTSYDCVRDILRAAGRADDLEPVAG